MDDSCAVCADSLEWVGYGSCGHREVCATCAIRLRFVLEDRRCCICKTESPTVFITRALGNYTRIITDFSVFPAGANVGQVSSYWYHEGSQAYFDDVDQYRMIKAMCRLSCSMCDKSKEEQGIENTKRRSRFRSIEQLKGHLFHQHRMFMCSLCLQGRKVFICEQKLYPRSQLNQHIHTGDSEVDGSENERGGFMGHPMCEFCKNPFYGDNELYMHMSTEHYTCHICQRQHPGQYDYFRNYDDLETHFRQEHFLCEDDTCLTKKFIVFQTEAEMKRHNMIEHGGNMSRSKRNAALQIPTSFRYRQSNDQDQRRGRGRGFRPEPSNNQLSMAIQASLETAFADGRVRNLSSSVQPITDRGLTSRAETTGGSSESFSASSCSAPQRSTAANCQSSKNAITLEESYFPPLLDRGAPGPSSRYAQALNPGAAAKLAEELFPPLPSKKQSSKNKQRLEGLGNYNTLASRLNHGKGTVKVLNSGRPKLAVSQELISSNSASFPELKPIQKSQGSAVSTSLVGPSNSASFPQLESVKNQRPDSKPHATSQVDESSTSTGNEFSSPVSTNSTLNSVNGNKMKHSSSTHLDDVSKPTAGQSLPRVEDVHTANKSLVERIRVGLENDEEKFAAFKSISAEYRQGQINTWEYISYVEQFGLMHLVLELARLCPDPQKQQELIDAYNSNIRKQRLQENGRPNDAGGSKDGKNRKNEKGKSVYQAEDTNRKDQLADSFRDTVRKLQLNQKHQEEVEVLSKDGYRTAKSLSNSSSSQNPGGSGESSKHRRKTSKFFRARLGDESSAALLDVGCADSGPDPPDESSAALLDVGRADSGPDPPKEESSNRVSKGLPLPVQGVWKNKGGQKLVFK